MYIHCTIDTIDVYSLFNVLFLLLDDYYDDIVQSVVLRGENKI